MKKYYISIASLILSVLIIIGLINFNRINNNLQSKSFTPKELWDIQFQKKKEKRKNGYNKADKPDLFTKYFKEITTPIGDSEAGYKMNYKVEELSKAKAKKGYLKSAEANLNFISRGPANVGGRTRALMVDPDDATHNTWYAGAATGGIWKTSDGGATWINLSDQFTNLSVNSMAMSESNRDIMYAGTGESFPGGTGMVGNGIWKSTDRGANWSQVSSTVIDDDFAFVNRIVIDPTNPDIVLAATETGILKTSDGGMNWTKVYASNKGVEDLVEDPTDFNVLFAGEHGVGVIRSIDAGNNWVNSSSGLGSGTRFEIAVSPVNHNNVFVSANVSTTESKAYISKDKGLNWILFDDTQAFLSGQGDYDNTIEAHPYNEDEVFIGGVDVWKVAFNGTAGETKPQVIKAYTENTSFLTFVNFNGNFLGGGMSTTDGTNRDSADWVSVEIRFGAGLMQKAHRFNVPAGDTSGVPPANYSYIDYVDVPFEVWDVTNNRQLMVSFRDQEKDGVYNLYPRIGEGYGELGREYIFVNAIEYNKTTPNVNITKNGGHLYKNLYMFWPILADGATWTPDNLPSSKIIVEYGTIKELSGEKTSIADSYGAFKGPNGYDQGAGLGKASIPGLHPDHHNIVIIPTGGTNFTMLDGNDGGVGISKDNGESFTMLPNNYITTQFYGVAKNTEANEYIGGMQDNGTWQSLAGQDASDMSRYYFRLGGDGFECLWHAKDPNIMLGSIYYNSIKKSEDKGKTWVNAQPFGSSETNGPFVTKLSVSKENPDLVFLIGLNGVYRSTNFAKSWAIKSISPNWVIDNYVSSSHNVEVSLSNGNIVWAGGGMASSRGMQMHVSTNEGNTFSMVDDYSLVDMVAYTSGIATHPTEDSTAYILFSIQGKPKVLRTVNLGQSFEDISGFGTNSVSSNGFPDVVVQSLLVMPHDPNIIWVGTDIGLVESVDNGTTWHIAENGLPPVSVYDMQIVGHQVVIATHGRGIWSVDIPEIDNAPYIDEFTASSPTELKIITEFKAAYQKVDFYIDGELNKTLETPQMRVYNISLTTLTEGTHVAYMLGYINDKSFKSNTIDVSFSATGIETVNVVNKDLTVYPNPSKGEFYLKFNSGSIEHVSVEVYNLSGLLVYKTSTENKTEFRLDITSLKAGAYLLKINSDEKEQIQKILIQK